MKAKGLRKAYQELEEASRAAEKLRTAATLRDAEEAWIDLVERFGRFFNKLAAAAKGNTKAEQFVKRVNAERSKDEALTYLLQCRNQAEHGFDEIVQREPGSLTLPPGSTVDELWVTEDGVGGVFGLQPGLTVVQRRPSLRLIPVLNRGVDYPVPTSHLGTQFYASAQALADAAIAYGGSVLNEAEKLG